MGLQARFYAKMQCPAGSELVANFGQNRPWGPQKGQKSEKPKVQVFLNWISEKLHFWGFRDFEPVGPKDDFVLKISAQLGVSWAQFLV